MDQAEKRLMELGYTLPVAPSPAANYLPYRISGKQLYLSGVLPMIEGSLTHTGAVGDSQTVESGYEAARNCALNVLAAITGAIGSLDRVNQVLVLNGFVFGIPGFSQSSQVINGASDLLAEVLGEAGGHARAAVTVAGLPLNATVELQVVVEFS